ncbi:protein of unknown function [Taphrina deformans PYCC 5710]|uniref:Vacuolar calcium ion transporter n=1 Tax=Taphrina deformans (strain PYCC 5710 / ATCC 11124 / CBS 356.35 / IMI 108563 / JCM 9778 / NBRC 8474) TaxID=1097556 RepID=R4XED4_TAPDE|nr:protein of unknown function [Taphrina deformans PYCC 5710]|eukprot:CCG84192.1 protein of unknown function [Taphrina deformans PYCC 5710]
MHRIKHEAHKETYGRLSASNDQSRTSSPRRLVTSAKPPDATEDIELRERAEVPEFGPIQGSLTTILNNAIEQPALRIHDSQSFTPAISNESSATRIERLKTILSRILFFSWINVLLVMVPIAVAVHFTTENEVVKFITSTVAIIPLAAMLGYSTEELAKRFGPTSGALFNITFGNATELIVFIIGIVRGQLNVVQAAIIGSVLGNLLLILGMAFLLGGIRYKEQHYNSLVTQTTGCLLLLAITSLSIPTAFHASFVDSDEADQQVLYLSYATSIVLLVVYGVYLIFQLRTHAHLYKAVTTTQVPSIIFEGSVPESQAGEHSQTTMAEESTELPQIPVIASIVLLFVTTALVAVMAEFMVSSISAVVQDTGLSEQFVGLIIVPIVGNAAEHICAVTVAYRNKVDLSISIALGSSLQIVLLVAPLAVLLSWAIGQPLTLYFSLFETLSVFATVLIVTYLVIDGRSNYLEGVLLIAAYILIAIASLFYPATADEANA